MGKIKPGEAVTVSCDAAPELRHAAKVIQVSPVVDPSSGTMEVLAEVTGAPADLRPGMSADIRLGSAK